MNEAPARVELSASPTSFGQSKNSLRLLFFVVLSVAMCLAALANVASASAATAAEDQYIEQAPNGGGQDGGTNTNNFVQSVGGGDGNVSEADVKKAAKKNKDRSADGDGSTGSTGAAGSGTTQPPAGGSSVGSVATAAKFGPFSRTTFLLIVGIALALGGVALSRGGAFGQRHASSRAFGSAGGPPTAG